MFRGFGVRGLGVWGLGVRAAVVFLFTGFCIGVLQGYIQGFYRSS